MSNIRTVVRGAYDIQKLRIQTGNRIVGNFKVKLGQEPGTKEEDMDLDAQILLDKLRVDYDLITDGVVELPPVKKFKATGIISTYTELVLVDQYFRLAASEKRHFKQLERVLQEYPIYNEFLLDVRGVGPAMAGVIVSEIDITKCEYPSSIWKYAGLDVADNGAGRSRKKEHLVEKEYTDKEGNLATRAGITFNPFLKTKLIGVLGTSFIKQPADKCVYREIYDNYKHRLENNEAHAEKTKLHRHNMAIRYMVKRFLADLYTAWRTIEGLPVAPEYSEAKLGKVHRKAA